MTKLIQTTNRVYYYPYDDAKDRPILGYIRGDDFSVAVDAGHSAEHVAEFYAAIEAEGLPLPAMTVIFVVPNAVRLRSRSSNASDFFSMAYTMP